MHESELSRRLAAVADQVHARPDLSEVEFGAARVRSRRRVATGVIAAMLVAGAGGAGFGLGQSVGRGDDATGALEPVATVPATTDSAPDAPVATAPPTDAPAEPSDEPTLAPSPGATADDDVAISDDESMGRAEPGVFSGEPWMQEFELISERTTAAGYRLRLLRSPAWGEDVYGPFEVEGQPAWTPPAFCTPAGELRATIDGPDFVDVGGGSWYGELFGPASISVNNVGWAEGQPMSLVIVQVDPEVLEVAVYSNDGSTDRAAVVDGFVALVVPGGDGLADRFLLDLVSASGTTTVAGEDLELWLDPEYSRACSPPPPALPDAGEQPADPAAARAAFDERFALVWDFDNPNRPADVLDDDTGVAEALEIVQAAGFSEAAASAEFAIEEFVFTSATEAWFLYGIETSSGYFGQRYGFARLADAGWTFPRALVCQDLALAGGVCEPQPFVIYPPSWYEQNGGQQCIYDPVDGTETCAGYDEVMATF